MFVPTQLEEAVNLGIKKLQLGKATRPMIVEGIKNDARALPLGDPGLSTAEGDKKLS